MAHELLVLERRGKVATITLNRPDKRNALSAALRDEVRTALEELDADDSVSVGVFTGAGPAFCAGFDRTEFDTGGDVLGEFSAGDLAANALRFTERLQYFSKPLVAAVNGPAMGGGFDLAVQCDVRIASENAAFGHPEIKFGAPTLFTQLSRIIGGGLARDLCLSGRRIDANEALRIGLVSRVVPADRLLEEVAAYAEEIAEAPLPALRAVKQAIIDSAPLTVP